MISDTPSYTTSFFGAQFNDVDSLETEKILDNIENTIKCDSRSFAIEIIKHSTTSLASVSIPIYSSQQEIAPMIFHVAQNSTLPWVDRVIKFSEKGAEDTALKEISEITTKLKLSQEEYQISIGFSQLSRHQLPDIIAIALLRNTSTFRSKISFWEEFLTATEKRLQAKGKNPKKLLRGLKQ